jgi:hypothetical protein
MVSTGITIGFIYSARVKQIALNELNKHLLTEVDVKNIEFSVFKKFPYATLEFSDVTVKDSFDAPEKGILLQASSLYFHFNLLEILKGKYELRKIRVSNGIANILIDKNGRENFKFWNNETSDEEQNVKFSADEILLKNFIVQFKDERNGNNILAKTEASAFKGDFSKDAFNMTADMELFADVLAFNNVAYVKKQIVKAKINTAVDKVKEIYTLNASEFSVAGLNFKTSGAARGKEKAIELNLIFEGDNINIESLLTLLPKEYAKYTKDYKSRGIIDFKGNIAGIVSEKTSPDFTADFSIQSGEFQHQSSDVKIQNIFFNGEFSSKNQTLTLNRLTCNIGSGSFSGKAGINNFHNPQLSMDLNGAVDPAEILALFPNEHVEYGKGLINFDIRWSGPIKSKQDFTKEDFRNSKISGNLSFKDSEIKLTNNDFAFEQLDAHFTFDNRDILVNAMSAKYGSSDFSLSGHFRNIVLKFLKTDEHITVEAKIKSSKIDLDELLAKDQSKGGETEYKLELPQDVNFSLDLTAQELVFRKFKAENIKGKALVNENSVLTENLTFSACGGDINFSGSLYENSDKNFTLSCAAEIKNINIQNLFFSVENFGQEVMKDEHLKGKATASLGFTSVLKQDLSFDKKSIHAKCAILIEEGELKNFSPLMSLSKFMKVPDFSHVRFASLSNVIEIKDEKIFIPKTEIISSAINLTVSGTHSFNNDIDYHFRLLLSYILARKVKENNKNTEFGTLEDDDRKKMSVFVAMKGTVDNPRISYDGLGLQEKVKQDVQQEKQLTKALLKEEFGIFKSDTSLKAPAHQKEIKHAIEWEEFENNKKSESSAKKATPSTEKKEIKKTPKWLDKIAGSEHEKEYE